MDFMAFISCESVARYRGSGRPGGRLSLYRTSDFLCPIQREIQKVDITDNPDDTFDGSKQLYTITSTAYAVSLAIVRAIIEDYEIILRTRETGTCGARYRRQTDAQVSTPACPK